MPGPGYLPDECNGTTYTSLKGKIVLLTGIGQQGDPNMWGNGAATARIFIANGAKVFGCDLNLPSASSTKKRLTDEFGEGCCTIISADVTKSADVKTLVDTCMKTHGRIDILVNNVGLSQKGDPASMDEETWDKQIDVNLKSVYLTSHLVLPIMEVQGKGSIINISSIAGLRYIGKPQVAYNATKAAVIQFTKATAVVYAPKGVRLNVVVPGLMYTPLVGSLAEKYAGGDLEGLVKTRNEQVPMGRMGSPFDVANAVLFLASDSAGYITGQKLVVDGAITCSTGRT